MIIFVTQGSMETIQGQVLDTLRNNLTDDEFQVSLGDEDVAGTFRAPDSRVMASSEGDGVMDTIVFGMQIGGPNFNPPAREIPYTVWYKLTDDPDRPVRPISTYRIKVS